MTEFVDTNILVYAHDSGAGRKYKVSMDLLGRLFAQRSGAISIQVLLEFYYAALKKLPLRSEDAEQVIFDLQTWTIHRPAHADVLRACRIQREFGANWWDAQIVNSATELGCNILWTEDLNDGQEYGPVTVRNPFTS
jgi:predicted nucleic acid-binding protein